MPCQAGIKDVGADVSAWVWDSGFGVCVAVGYFVSRSFALWSMVCLPA